MAVLRSILFATCLLVVAACSTALRESQPTLDLTGDWVLTTTSQMGVQDADMIVRQTGTQLAGQLSGPQGPMGYSGSLEGNAVRFSFTFDAGGQPIQIEYTGVASRDTMSGKAIFGPLSEGTFTAKRKGPSPSPAAP